MFFDRQKRKRVPGSKSPEQLQPIRTSRTILRAKSLESGCHIKLKDSSNTRVGAGIAQWLEHRTRD